MIQINNFLIKREQSQARLSFAKREKSRLLAKTILTLVALLAVTLFTGLSASAQNLTLKLSDALYDQENYTYYAYNDGDKSIAEGTYVQINMSTYHTQVMNIYMNGEVVYTKPSGDVYTNDVYHFTAGPNCKILGGISNRFDWESNPNIYITMDASVAASGPKVAWDKDKKTGKFTMPGGNVTLEPEYYPQATVADGGVTAADADARATTDDPLVKVDATKLTGAKKLMYFVSNSGTTAPAYDAEGWTDQLPTAEGLTQQGIVYVWYYPVGIDEGVDGATATYSDGDMNATALAVTIAPEPTYAVTFKAANANTIEAGKATVTVGGTAATVTEGKLQGVKMGSEVKVKANTGYKFRKVEVKKKGATLTITVAKGSTDLSGDKLLYYTPGETYRQAIANHPENKLDGGLGWNIWEGGNDATIFYKESTDKSRDLSIAGYQHFGPTDSINLDTVIDPTLNFYFVAQF